MSRVGARLGILLKHIAFKVIFRLKTRSNIKKYKLDNIQFTIFILEDPVIVYGESCLIAN